MLLLDFRKPLDGTRRWHRILLASELFQLLDLCLCGRLEIEIKELLLSSLVGILDKAVNASNGFVDDLSEGLFQELAIDFLPSFDI